MSANFTVNMPFIIAQPQNSTNNAGDTVNFSVAATGTPPLIYQWRKTGNLISGATNAVFSIAGALLSDAGNYDVIVSNFVGSVTSSIVVLTVNQAAAGIITPPTASAIIYGQTLTGSILSGGTASVPGIFAFVDTTIAPNAGSTNALVSFTPTDTNDFTATTCTVNVTVNQATATVALMNLTQYYNDTPRPVTITTSPIGLNVIVTYNGSNGIPSAIGSYTVIGVINDPNFYGSATNTLVIQSGLPFITQQPTNQAVVMGNPANFIVMAGGPGPFGYQWLENNSPLMDGGTISGSGTSNLTLSAVAAQDSGNYSVMITNVWGSVTSSNANLVVNAEVYVAGTNAMSGGTVSVPINLKALGQEISLQFSLSFNPNILIYQGVDNSSVIVTTNSPLPGQIGFTFQNFAGYSPGDQTLVSVVFVAQPVTSNTVSPIYFADVPVGRQVIDGSFNVLTNVIYNGGSVTVVPAEYAADVYPRPTGDSTVDLRDWAEMGRFVTALDVVSNADEMLRADCAPRGNPDGVLTVADWVQAGRYAAKLDPLTVVSSGGITPQVKPLAGIHPLGSSLSLIQLVGSTATNGETVTVPVNLVASGSENALGFNVAFDPTQLTLQGIAKGSAAGSTVMNVNTNQSATGHLGVTLALNSGNVFASGTNQIVKLSFKVLNQASGNLGVAFVVTNPVVEQVCGVDAGVLNASYTSAIILVQSGPKPTLQIQLTNGMVNLSWPQAFGNYMLQSIGNMGSGVWNSNIGSPSVQGSNWLMTLPATNAAQFYRLSH